MEKYLSDIITDVRTTIDDIAANDAEFADEQDFSELGTIVRSKLCEAVDYVHGAANMERMKGDAAVIKDGTADSSGDVEIEVEDMLRFCYAKVSQWKKSVTEYVLYGSTEHIAAMDEYAGASIYRPAVILIPSWRDGQAIKGKKLMLVPGGENQTGEVCYIKKCEIMTEEVEPEEETSEVEDSSENDTTEEQESNVEYVVVDGGLYEAMINYLSGLVLMVMNDNRGENLIALAKNEIGAETK